MGSTRPCADISSLALIAQLPSFGNLYRLDHDESLWTQVVVNQFGLDSVPLHRCRVDQFGE
jgi:hypothetical protein